MSRILAAIDESETGSVVLAVATALARLTSATAEVMHVREDGREPMRSEAHDAGLSLHESEGDVVERIVAAAAAADVRAVVIGSRRTPDVMRPTGHVAVALLTRLTAPLVVVPPTAGAISEMRRMLVPLDGTAATAARARVAIDLATEGGIEAVVVHVCDEPEIPMFTDQPQHETRAFADEFVDRYAPDTPVTLELRIGDPAEEILAAAEALDVDLIAIVWAQLLEPGRAAVVNELLVRSHVPLLFLPIDRTTDPSITAAAEQGGAVGDVETFDPGGAGAVGSR